MFPTKRATLTAVLSPLVGIAAGLAGALTARGGDVPFTEHVISTTADDGDTSVFATDVDGDGDTDVLSASGKDNKIAWYEKTSCEAQVYADICEPFDPPSAPQPNLDDILCLLGDFADGPGVDGCACNGFRMTTDLHPCREEGGGDGSIDLDDIRYMRDALGGNPPCDDPCPG